MLRKIFLVMGVMAWTSACLQADYVIQLGLYKDKSLLQKKINSINDSALRSNIIIEKRGDLYWAHSKAKKDRESLADELSRYREYFKDAFPKKVSSIKIEKGDDTRSVPPIVSENVEKKTKTDNSKSIVKSHQPEPEPDTNKNIALKKVDQKETPETEVASPDNDIKNENILPFKKQLKGSVFYICYESKNREIVRVEFDEQYINYSTVVGDRHPFKVFYKVKNGRLYTFRDKLSKNSVYLTLEEKKEKYLLISTWYEGEKVKRMRYYHDLQNAMEHMNRD